MAFLFLTFSPKNLFYNLFWTAEYHDELFPVKHQSLIRKSKTLLLKKWKSEEPRLKFFRIFSSILRWNFREFPKYHNQQPCIALVLVWKHFYKTYNFSRKTHLSLLKKCSWLLKVCKAKIGFDYFLISFIDTSAVPFNGCKAKKMLRLKKKNKKTMPKGTRYFEGG